jgi:hypothetical protein
MRTPPESARCTNQATQNAHILPDSGKIEMNPKSQIRWKTRNFKTRTKIVAGNTRISPSPALVYSHTSQILGQGSQSCRSMWPTALGARYRGNQGTSSSAPHHTEAMSGGRRYWSSTSIAGVATLRRRRRRREGMGGWHGQSWDGSGLTTDLAQLFYPVADLDP